MDDIVCECGQVHEFAAETRFTLSELGPLITVEMVKGQRYRVPRIWIAAHGITGETLPDLAARYGWEIAP